MHSPYRNSIRQGVLAGIVALAAFCAQAAYAGKNPPLAAMKAPDPTEFVGSETCLAKGCHSDKGAVLRTGPHARAFNPNAPATADGCEVCHGSGKRHVAEMDKTKIVSPENAMPSEYSTTCTNCHDRMRFELWSGSQHDTRNVGCATCHSVHAPQSEKAQLKAKDETELCGSCHRAIVNKTNRFSHMPVREGKMVCASCHDMHGSSNQKLLRAGTTVDESCTSCHPEKRGPFLWEHAPVAESCTSCHDSHGTNNTGMLVSKEPFLCQRCHVTNRHPPTIYDGYVLANSSNSNKIYGRSCAACHQTIHGSNSPNGKAFLR
jgi:DmsE family decaheme c-type cytochrome